MVSKNNYEQALEKIALLNQSLADKKLLMAKAERLEKERKTIDNLIAVAVEEAELKAAIQYDALKKESDRIHKELEAQVAKLRKDIQQRESSHKQLLATMHTYHQEHERLKIIEGKWLELEQAKEFETRKAMMEAQYRQEQSIRNAPAAQSQSPQSSTPQRDQKNLTPGR